MVEVEAVGYITSDVGNGGFVGVDAPHSYRRSSLEQPTPISDPQRVIETEPEVEAERPRGERVERLPPFNLVSASEFVDLFETRHIN